MKVPTSSENPTETLLRISFIVIGRCPRWLQLKYAKISHFGFFSL
jgi:hypothetical protein